MKSQKKYLGWAVMALVVYWIVVHPTEAAATVGGLFSSLTGAAESVSVFANALN